LTIGSSGAEGFCPSSQTHAQLLRRVVISGRRTIRWLLSPRSISAPTVRPMLVFLHRQFIRRFTDALVPPVITVRRDSSQSNPNSSSHRPAPDAAAFVLTSSEISRARASSAVLRARRRLLALAAGRRASPPRPNPHARAADTHLGFHRRLQFRSHAAISARRRPPGGAQGPSYLPQPHIDVHSFVVVRTSPISPLHCTARVPMHCFLGILILFFTIELQCLKSRILWS
jgi:hypothetical protein